MRTLYLALLALPLFVAPAQEFVFVPPTAGSSAYALTITGAFTASSSDPWLTVTPTAGSNSQTITYAYTANASPNARLATLTLGNKTVAVTQLGATGAYTQWGFSTLGGLRTVPSTPANLSSPGAVAVDGNGNLYIADTANHRIRKVTATGVVSNIAGTGIQGYTGDSGPALIAQLRDPSGIALDQTGNIYIADSSNHVIRKVTIATGAITTVAGIGAAGFAGDGGPATAARLSSPLSVVLDRSGNLYIADSFNNRIRKVDAATNTIVTIAGTGAQGFSGDGGFAFLAQLASPFGLAIDANDNLYFADFQNARIRKVTASTQIISSIAGTGVHGFSGDGGQALAAQLQFPYGVAVDGPGNVYIADTNNNRIRKVSVGTNIISTLSSQLAAPRGVAVDGASNIYVADTANQQIRFIDNVTPALTLSATSATVVDASSSATLTVDSVPTGALWVASSSAPWLTVSSASGVGGATLTYNYATNPTYTARPATITINDKTFTLLQTGAPAPVTSASVTSSASSRTFTLNTGAAQTWTAVSSASWLTVTPATGTGSQTLTLTFSANAGSNGRMATVTVAGQSFTILQAAANGNQLPWGYVGGGNITTVAGTGNFGNTGNGGLATNAQLANPQGIAVDGNGNFYFADTKNHSIRRVDADTKIITLFAGSGASGFSGDGGPATSARLFDPLAVAVDPAGNLYIADYTNNRIRRRDAITGNITTYAGGSPTINTADGVPATSASLSGPTGVALDAAGNLFLVESRQNRIRKVDAVTNLITTVPTTGLNQPYGIAIDAAQNIYITDLANQRVKKIDTTGSISTVAGTGTEGYSGDGGPATAANLSNPAGITTDRAGNVYFADYTRARIRKLTVATGFISTVAGTGALGFSNDLLPALSANLNYPVGVATDGAGNLFIGDNSNNRVRMVDFATPSVVLTPSAVNLPSTAGSASLTLTVSPAGGLWIANSNANWLTLPVSSGTGSGTLNYTVTANNTLLSRTALVTVNGVPSTITQAPTAVTLSPTGVNLTAASFTGTFTLTLAAGVSWTAVSSAPWLIVTSSSGTGPATLTYTAGTNTSVNGRLATILIAGRAFTVTQSSLTGAATSWGVLGNGIIRTIAGTGSAVVSGNGGLAISAGVTQPQGVAADANGSVYLVDPSNHTIRRVDASNGSINQVAGIGSPGFNGDGSLALVTSINNPLDVAVDSAGNIIFSDYGNNRVRRINAATGTITTIAGTGPPGTLGDGGPATAAQLTGPIGVTVDRNDNVYFADATNRVRRIDAATGIITKVAGGGASASEGVPAASSVLNAPYDVAVNNAGDIYIADKSNHRIRKVDANTGTITTIAGTGFAGFNGDGGPALSAQINTPAQMAFDLAGNLHFADFANNRIRKIDAATGIISTVAGGGPTLGDNGFATAAQLNNPVGIAFDPSGNLVIGDYRNNRVRFVDYTTPPAAPAPPILAAATPSATSATTQTFTITLRDPNGATDINNVYFLISPTAAINANGCHGYYNRVANEFSLYNDALSALAPSLQNSQCAIVVNSSTATTLGTDIILTLTLRRQGAYTYGAQKLFVWVTDNANTGTGWLQASDWPIAANQAPTLANVTPTTSTVVTETFQLTARDGNGFTDINRVYFLLNTDTNIPTNGCHGFYDRASNQVFLFNDALSAVSGITLGQSGAVQNGQCAINAASSSVITSGTDVILQLNITRRGAYANGAKNLYAWVTDLGNLGTGWLSAATWNIAGQQPPTYVSATPAAGIALTEDITILARDANGGTDISRIYFLLDTSTTISTNGCHGYYDRVAAKVFLYNDALTSVSAASPTAQNSQCAVGNASVNINSTDLRLFLTVTRQGAYTTGAKNLYVWIVDSVNTGTGWVNALSWTPGGGAAQPPQIVQTNPASSNTATQTISVIARDPNGATDIQRVYFLINTDTAIPAGSCHGYYDRPTNAFYVFNDNLTAITTNAQNSQCSINTTAASAFASGTDLSLSIPFTRQGAYANGTKNVYFWAVDSANLGTGWQLSTVWNLGTIPPQPPVLLSATPATSTTATQMFSIIARDPNGATDIGRVYFLVNTNSSVTSGSCHGFYDRAANAVFLYNDALTALTGTLQNSQCAINGSTFSAGAIGLDLGLNLAITRQGAYSTGTRSLYVWVTDTANTGTGWVQASAWTL